MTDSHVLMTALVFSRLCPPMIQPQEVCPFTAPASVSSSFRCLMKTGGPVNNFSSELRILNAGVTGGEAGAVHALPEGCPRGTRELVGDGEHGLTIRDKPRPGWPWCIFAPSQALQIWPKCGVTPSSPHSVQRAARES